MKFYYKLFSIVFLFPLFSLAQSNYKPGYLVNLKGDTLHGFINYREWNSSPDAIIFKSGTNANPQKFTVNEIRYFSVEELESYQKYTGLISMDATNTQHLFTVRDTSNKEVSVFLKVLQKGKNIALYSYTDALKSRFFVSETPDYKMSELVYRIYEGPETKQGTTVNENTYQKQLYALAIKYHTLDDDLTNTFQKTDYTTDDLLAIVSKINRVSKAEIKRKNDKSSFSLFAGLNLNITTISPAVNSGLSTQGGYSHTSYLPGMVIGINGYVNPYTQKLIFRLELSASGAQYKVSYKDKFSPYIQIDYAYNQLTVAVTPQVIYNIYNADKLKFFIGAGFNLDFHNYSGKVFKAHDTYEGNITTADPFLFFTKTSQGTFKAGSLINRKIELYASYSVNTRISNDYIYQADENNIRIGINYIFGK
jgi:hypothetical protein